MSKKKKKRKEFLRKGKGERKKKTGSSRDVFLLDEQSQSTSLLLYALNNLFVRSGQQPESQATSLSSYALS